MKKNSYSLPNLRRYRLFREMCKRVNDSGKEDFTVWDLRESLDLFSRNRTTVRKDLEELASEGLVLKGRRLNEIVTYKPDGPDCSLPMGRIRGNLRACAYDLVSLRLLARENMHFECPRCGKLFADAATFLGPLFPYVRLCPFCLSNSKLSLCIRIRPRLISDHMRSHQESSDSLRLPLREPEY